jgi:hypothetical protein
VVVLLLPNLAVAALFVSVGVPLNVDGSGSGALGQLVGFDAGDQLTLLGLTDRSVWWWLAPVAAGVTLAAVTLVLVLRHDTLSAARREGFRFSAALAACAFWAALLTHASIALRSLAVAVAGIGSDGDAGFNPVLAALVTGVWALVVAVVVPQAARHTPSMVTREVRTRLGTAHALDPHPSSRPAGSTPT